MKIKNPIRLAALVVAAALLTLAAAAATLEEMYENGVVSDGNVRFGDARDGATGSVTGDDFGLNDDNILPGRSGAESGSAASSTSMPDTAAGTDGAGMVFGIILAVLVILAVVVLVMLFMPKKRG